jgi:hypothetical protein
MKSLTLVALCLFTFGISFAQDKFSVPELTQDQVQEVLYAHVFSYAVSGISYAKSMGSTPKAYGNYVGKLFTPFWDPSAGLPGFANQMMFILAGIHPDNEMEIMAQDENSISFRLKNVDLSFKQGPMFGVSYDDFLEFSNELLVVIADFMSLDFNPSFVDGWYEVSLKAR